MALPPPAADRTCLVTGASSGIGTEIARVLAARGLGVTLVARREPELRALADELHAAHDVRAEVLPTDLADHAARAALPDRLADLGLAADVLVNNAGFSTIGPIQQADPDEELRMIATNVDAVVHLCTLFVPGMVERGRGAVCNVASVGAFQPLPGQAGYAASKAFVLSYSHGIRQELVGTGVTVSALCPGPVRTGFVEAAGLSDDEAAGSLPEIMWVPVEKVAADAVEGLAKERPVVIPGVVNQLGAAGGYLLPRRLLLPILARQHPALHR
ncbi:MAG TPA: SDR family oxidoreductase [Acidimicrobiales bacterium]|nr:SDR family oxidoreductase [Acidimicrobiales bacterium]